MQLALIILTAIVFSSALIPFLRIKGWWVRGFDFPRLQLALASGAIAIADILLLVGKHDWGLFACLAACTAFVIQAAWILPYTRLWKREVSNHPAESDNESITLMTANVLQPNRNAKGFLEIVESANPDILVVLEANAWWQEQIDCLDAPDRFPYCIKCPLENLYGMLVYSKFPLRNAKTQFLIEDDVPSIHTLAELPSQQGIRMHFLHPAPPSPSENTESTERDAELIMVGKSVAQTNFPTIVTGDLNDVAWSNTTRLFRKISRLRDPRIGRGMFNTFNAQHWYLRWPLDHLFCSEHFHLQEIRRLPEFGSDHFPMLVKLAFAPDKNQNADSPPQADDFDKENAEEDLQAENASPVRVHQPERIPNKKP